MDLHKSLFWIYFIIIMKITFTVYNTNLKGTEAVQNFGPIIWNNIYIEIRSIENFDTFKTEIRKWKPTKF